MDKKRTGIMSTAVALLVLASVIGMAGCSGEENEKDHTSVSEKPSEEEKIELITETAPQDGLNLQALSNGKSAVSVWKINLNEQAVAVTGWVKDAAIVCGETERRSDGMCLYLSKASPEWGYTAGVSSKIFAAPDGTVSSYQATDAQTMAEKDLGADVKVFRWAETAGDVCGYKVAFSVPPSGQIRRMSRSRRRCRMRHIRPLMQPFAPMRSRSTEPILPIRTHGLLLRKTAD